MGAHSIPGVAILCLVEVVLLGFFDYIVSRATPVQVAVVSIRSAPLCITAIVVDHADSRASVCASRRRFSISIAILASIVSSTHSMLPKLEGSQIAWRHIEAKLNLSGKLKVRRTGVYG